MNNEIHNRKYLKEFRKELRNNPTKAEIILWRALRKSQQANRKFRRQHSIENFIVDFYCPSEKLVVEVDGNIHENAINNAYDSLRTKRLNELGFKVVRFTNHDIKEHLEIVLEAIKQEFKR